MSETYEERMVRLEQRHDEFLERMDEFDAETGRIRSSNELRAAELRTEQILTTDRLERIRADHEERLRLQEEALQDHKRRLYRLGVENDAVIEALIRHTSDEDKHLD